MSLLNQVDRYVNNYSWQSAEVCQSLSKCCTFCNSFISTTLWDANCCWAPFIDEETESQKGEVVCSVNEEGHQALPLCCCSLAQSRPTLWDPTDCSTPGFPVLHDHPEFAQTLLHWISDAISSSVAPSPPALWPLALYQSTCDCPHAQPMEQQSVCSH